MAATASDDEALTIRAFVEKPLQERWLLGLGKRTRRTKLLDRLSHHYDWDRRYATELPVPPHEDAVAWLVERLQKKGAPDACQVVGGPASDGSTMPLSDAVAHCLGYGALLVCVPGHLALHLPEAPAEPVLLAR